MNVDDYLVAAYKQEGDYCVALCANWLQLRCHYMASGKEGAAQRKANLREHTAASIMNNASNPISQPKVVLNRYGLKMGYNSPRANYNYNYNDIYTQITDVKRRMNIILLTCYKNVLGTELGNHALALYLSKGSRIHLFDPNYGEYYMGKYDFSQFMTLFLYTKYCALEKDILDIFEVVRK